MNNNDQGFDPFDQRLWGPKGWTAPLAAHVAVVDPNFRAAEAIGGLRRFLVPLETAEYVGDGLRLHDVRGVERPDPEEYLAVARALAGDGDDVLVGGYFVDPSRGDERAEFTVVRVMAIGWDNAKASIAERHVPRPAFQCRRLGDAFFDVEADLRYWK